MGYEDGGGHLAMAGAEGVAVPPVLRTAVLTCMDSRIAMIAAETSSPLRGHAGSIFTPSGTLALSRRKSGSIMR
jgi:hypothetical protein